MAQRFEQSLECQIAGCQEPAGWYPTLVIWPKGDLRRLAVPARATLYMGVCDGHKKTLKPADVVTDEGWRRLVEAFDGAGKLEPGRDLLQLEFARIEGSLH